MCYATDLMQKNEKNLLNINSALTRISYTQHLKVNAMIRIETRKIIKFSYK